ncbi:MAG TPA: serine hydrolase [Thermotogota bacterium]|nr:serine hydrolase [Thermotogota bacterium]
MHNRKKIFFVLIVIVLIVVLFFIGYGIYGKLQMDKIPGLSFKEALNYTLEANEKGIITVGIVKDGQATYRVYGKEGAELPAKEYIYEIGSLTKTFTATLLAKAVKEGKVSLEDTLDDFLDLPGENDYPTLRQLVTHTSGYKAYYFESPMIGNFLSGKNDFYTIDDKMIMKKLSGISTPNKVYPFNYSNFGYAALGLVLEAVYNEEYTTLVNHFVQEELNLQNTKISDGNGDLDDYWDWEKGDAYLPAGGLTSEITDMLHYAQLQLSDEELFSFCHESLETINASTENYQRMGIHMDEMAMSWIVDDETGIYWHNGGTGNYNCYLGFQPESEVAVVILSNLPPNYRIPSTLLGVKLFGELLH